jgi:hypothetical protein
MKNSTMSNQAGSSAHRRPGEASDPETLANDTGVAAGRDRHSAPASTAAVTESASGTAATDPRLQAALDALSNERPATDKEALIVAKCRGLVVGYHQRWKDAGYSVDAVEALVTSGLWNPETGRQSRSFILAGKLDVTGFRSRRVLFDHKSTSEDITDPNSPYWRQLIVEAQPSHYALLEWLNGRKVDEIVWDVMRKPGISPKNVAKADAAAVRNTGRYFGLDLSKESLTELGETGRESLEMYTARLAYDCTEVRPQWYFQRRTVPRSDADIHEYATELWAHSQDILYARRENRWPRNSGACMLYGSPCKFLAVCSKYDDINSDKWKRKKNVHNELPMLEGDGRDVLTNSRIRTFQTCRRKHLYEYELGIDRQDEEERESLVFGTIWHRALETWNNAVKEADVESLA